MDNKRFRRTRVQLERDMFEALANIIKEVGFSDIQLNTLTDRARIDPNVFYRRFENVNDMFVPFIESYDPWMNNHIIDQDMQTESNDRKYLAEALKKVYKVVANDKIMQKIILWEISDSSETTKFIAEKRELLHTELRNRYEKLFSGADFNILTMLAIIFAGVYYLSLHKDVAPFCSLDLTRTDHESILNDSLEKMTDILFDYRDKKLKLTNTVRMMIEDGITIEKVGEYLGLSAEDIREMAK